MDSISQEKPSADSLNSVSHKIKLADEYLSAFNILMGGAVNVSAVWLPMMFMLSHCLELLLKSYVKMVTQNSARRYSHRLSDLWADSKHFGLLSEMAVSEQHLEFFVHYLEKDMKNMNSGIKKIHLNSQVEPKLRLRSARFVMRFWVKSAFS